MSAAVESIVKATSLERRIKVSMETDARQDAAVASAMSRGFMFTWDAILRDLGHDPVREIDRALGELTASRKYTDTITALGLNGKMIATYAQLRTEQEAGLRDASPVLAFAETPDISTPEKAIAFWQKFLGLTDDQVETLLRVLPQLRRAANNIVDRVNQALVDRLSRMWSEQQQEFIRSRTLGTPISEGESLSSFIKKSREIMPDYSRDLLETEYRTRLTQQYGDDRQQLLIERASTFPFTQFMAIKDTRTTWWICLPMGKAGPNGTGYIAATTDPIWIKWRPPNHFRCRSDCSGISYREAQRMGILAADGKTKLAKIGNNPNRPYGDPPKFATEPGGDRIRAVEPQEGFG